MDVFTRNLEMMILTTSDESLAPWNQKDLDRICPDCGSENIEVWDEGEYKYKTWTNYKCNDCGHKWGNEPDFD